MKPGPRLAVRCAIYTRVSDDARLDQEFNSLDAQFDAASAYIRSQAHAGWSAVRARYDDGGFSGGSTDRPALQRLLADVRERRINVIVVYKVDRLTRSLADFAKLVELFDAHDVSFVSVTQQFNTTTSMGRLTLNVLLSFAQFEREVTSERIRDKIEASKRKGLWVGGVVPLGYHARDRSVRVVESEAETVRHIFRRYLELGSLNLLLSDLRTSGVTTKVRPLSTGRTIGGIPFTRGPLAYLLRNRFYIGEVPFKGEVFKGEQPAILDRTLFDAVQDKLEEQRTNHALIRQSSDSLLAGLIFDDRGHRMTPTYVTKKNVRYRYYTSSALFRGEPASAGTVKRAAAGQIEELVTTTVRQHLSKSPRGSIQAKRTTLDAQRPQSEPTREDANQPSDGEVVRRHVGRVNVHAHHLLIHLRCDMSRNTNKRSAKSGTEGDVLRVAWSKRPSKLPREIIPVAQPELRSTQRPIRSETRTNLVNAIARGRYWLDQLVTGKVLNANDIAEREGCSVRQVNLTLSFAFLSPALVQAAVDGQLPRGIGIANLRDMPADWAAQHRILGLGL